MDNQNGNTAFVDETLAAFASQGSSKKQMLENTLKSSDKEDFSEEYHSEMKAPQLFDLRQEDSTDVETRYRILTNEEMDRIYRKSIQEAKSEQPVRGEMYAGQTPSLKKFVKSVLSHIIPSLQATYEQQKIDEAATDQSFQTESVPSLNPGSIFDEDTMELPIETPEENRSSRI